MSNTNNKTSRQNIVESIIIGIALTGISYICGILFGWINNVNWLEMFAVFTSYSCTYLCITQRRINYPIGAISSAAYAYLFLQSGLISSAILNAYLVPTLVYGWIRWRKDDNTRPVTHVSWRWLPVYITLTGLGYLGATLISQQFGGAMAWTDSLILALTILAQFLLDNKKLENWIVWAVVNVLAIYTYSTIGLPLVAFQYVLFLANTVYGYIIWKRSRDHVESICIDDSNATNNRTLTTDTVC